jgi:hypothetical protein
LKRQAPACRAGTGYLLQQILICGALYKLVHALHLKCSSLR